jgi:hypothetical protein
MSKVCLLSYLHACYTYQPSCHSSIIRPNNRLVDLGGQAVKSDGLRLIACRDCEFESRRGNGRLSLVECCVLSGRDVWDGPIPHPEGSHRRWYVTLCDLVTTRMRRMRKTWSAVRCCARGMNDRLSGVSLMCYFSVFLLLSCLFLSKQIINAITTFLQTVQSLFRS